MSDQTVQHDMFTSERTYDVAPSQVFAAWSDPAAKRRWFAEGEGFTDIAHTLDFREGGREHCAGREPGGMLFTNETVYLDILADRRIVFSYTMALDERRISASLATVEFEPAGDGTRLIYTEQAAFFEGGDGADRRKGGWNWLLDALGTELARTAA